MQLCVLYIINRTTRTDNFEMLRNVSAVMVNLSRSLIPIVTSLPKPVCSRTHRAF